MAEFINQVLNGLTLGSLFALVAVGYTMVYGIIKLINFAHSEFYMCGGFAGLLALTFLCFDGRPLEGLPPFAKLLLGIALAGCFVAGLAVFVEWTAYRPIRKSGRIAALLTAVGVSLFLQNSAIAVFGAKQTPFPETVPDIRYPRWSLKAADLKAGDIADAHVESRMPVKDTAGKILYWRVQGLAHPGEAYREQALAAIHAEPAAEVYAYSALTISLKQITVFVALLISAGLLYVLVQKTRAGRAMRAVSHDVQAAELMGVNPGRVISITFALGGFIAGMGGVLAGGMFVTAVDPMMGFIFGLKAFVAAVLGGIGRIQGALAGGLIMGLIEQLVQHYADHMLFHGASAYRDAIAFLILILVLLVRPSGLFGRFEGEKV